MISKETVDQIFSVSRVEEIIGDFMELKKAGSNYKGLSPFTAEKTPSFVVSPAKQIWKDFSSGKGGNVIRFLMEHEQFTYPEALEYLAKKYHIEIQREGASSKEDIEKRTQKETLFLIQNRAKDFFIKQLFNSQEGKKLALNYIQVRNLGLEVVKKYELGYAPNLWEFFSNSFLEKGFTSQELIASGLSLSKENGLLDRFRSRLIFPIHSFSGRVLGFAARSLKTSSEEAKYLNSPENEIYQKSKILYGIYQAKQSILRENEVFLVEGYIDVLSLFEGGVENVVAAGGTALTKEQIYLLKRLTSNIILLYDGDRAGIEASMRAIDLLLEFEMNVNVVSLPEGEDPDSFSKKNSRDQLIAYLREKKENFISFKLRNLNQTNKENPLEKALHLDSLLKTIAKISSPIYREIYLQEISKKLEISQEVLYHSLARVEQFQKEKNPKRSLLEVASQSFVDPLLVSEKEILKLLLCFGDKEVYLREDPKSQKTEKIQSTITGEIIQVFEEEELKFSDPFDQKIFDQILESYKKGKILSGDFFLHSTDNKIQALLTSYLEPYLLANWESRGIETSKESEKLSQILTDTLLRYKSNYLVKLISELGTDLTQASEEQRPILLKKIMRLTELKNQINKKLHRFV